MSSGEEAGIHPLRLLGLDEGSESQDREMSHRSAAWSRQPGHKGPRMGQLLIGPLPCPPRVHAAVAAAHEASTGREAEAVW